MGNPSCGVELRVPGKVAFVPVARLTSSPLALQPGFAFADARRLSRAVTEVLRSLIRAWPGSPRPAILLDFLVSCSRISVELRKEEGPPSELEPSFLTVDHGSETQLLRLAGLVDAIDVCWDKQRGVSMTLTKYGRQL